MEEPVESNLFERVNLPIEDSVQIQKNPIISNVRRRTCRIDLFERVNLLMKGIQIQINPIISNYRRRICRIDLS